MFPASPERIGGGSGGGGGVCLFLYIYMYDMYVCAYIVKQKTT